jgi:hypothetical protein
MPPKVVSVTEADFQALKLLVEGLMIRVDTLETENKDMKLRLNALESVKDDKDQFESETWSSIIKGNKKKSNEEIKVINAITAVSKDISKREKNVVIIGLPISTENEPDKRNAEDGKMINDLLDNSEYDRK